MVLFSLRVSWFWEFQGEEKILVLEKKGMWRRRLTYSSAWSFPLEGLEMDEEWERFWERKILKCRRKKKNNLAPREGKAEKMRKKIALGNS